MSTNRKSQSYLWYLARKRSFFLFTFGSWFCDCFVEKIFNCVYKHNSISTRNGKWINTAHMHCWTLVGKLWGRIPVVESGEEQQQQQQQQQKDHIKHLDFF